MQTSKYSSSLSFRRPTLLLVLCLQSVGLNSPNVKAARLLLLKRDWSRCLARCLQLPPPPVATPTALAPTTPIPVSKLQIPNSKLQTLSITSSCRTRLRVSRMFPHTLGTVRRSRIDFDFEQPKIPEESLLPRIACIACIACVLELYHFGSCMSR